VGEERVEGVVAWSPVGRGGEVYEEAAAEARGGACRCMWWGFIVFVEKCAVVVKKRLTGQERMRSFISLDDEAPRCDAAEPRGSKVDRRK
jgi:hypothetical protein